MQFEAKCGCRIEYHEISLLSGTTAPATSHFCEQHKEELLVKHLEIHGEITLFQIERAFGISETEVLSLLKKIEEKENDIKISVHNNEVLLIN